MTPSSSEPNIPEIESNIVPGWSNLKNSEDSTISTLENDNHQSAVTSEEPHNLELISKNQDSESSIANATNDSQSKAMETAPSALDQDLQNEIVERSACMEGNNPTDLIDVHSKDTNMQGHHHNDEQNALNCSSNSASNQPQPIQTSSLLDENQSLYLDDPNNCSKMGDVGCDDQNYGFDESDELNSMDGSVKGGMSGFHSNGVSKAKAPFVSNWLESNYEAFEGVSLPRSTLYAHYLERCRLSNVEPVNAASFGKIIRAVFPNLKTRRLGTRGNSKYHYYGIKLRSDPVVSMGMEANISAVRAGETKVSAPKPRSGSKKSRGDLMDNADNGMMGSRCLDKNGFPNSNTDEFMILLQEHCVPIHVNIPPQIPAENLQEFCHLYQGHCQRVIAMISIKEFVNLDHLLKQFWQSLGPKLMASLNCEEACRIIGVTDDLLHHTIIQMLLGNVLEPINLGTTQQIRHFAKNLETWLLTALDGFPISIVDVKIDSAKRFTHVLRRRTSLNHLAQAARTVLQNGEQVNQMLQDWNQIDFESVKEQGSWIVLCRENIFESIEESFRTYLAQGVSLEFWAEWLEGIVDQCMATEAVGGNEVLDPHQLHPSAIETAARQFLLKWSFFSTLIMRDLTLRSASSFGSFHLMRLLYDEYIFYIVERKLEDVKRRLYEEHWNSEAAVMMQQNEAYGHLGNAPAFQSDFNRNVNTVPAARLPSDQYHQIGSGKEVFDDYTNVYFGTDPNNANNSGVSTNTSFMNSERNLEGATGRMSQLLHDINSGHHNVGQATLQSNNPDKCPPRQNEDVAGFSQQKKKIRVDSSLAAILNC